MLADGLVQGGGTSLSRNRRVMCYWLEEPPVQYEGETWRVLSLGATNDAGKVYAHLVHPTRKHGMHPVAVCDWIDIPS